MTHYGLLPDWKIAEYATKKDMISPFVGKLNATGLVSYGLSAYGYDSRMADEFMYYEQPSGSEDRILDPKNVDQQLIKKVKADYFIIPPHEFVLARTFEYFKIPSNVLALCLGKSTYARCGLVVNVTPLEPGWEGEVTLEISNTTNVPVKIYANEGICQFLFYDNKKCDLPYNKRNGKYMGQRGVTLPKIKE